MSVGSLALSIRNIRLHHYPGLRSARVAWLLYELHQPFDIVRVDVFQGEQYSDAFRAVNPSHGLPVLECETENGNSMTMIESSAIIIFLADAWPDAHLAPAPSETRARAAYLQAMCFCAATLDMMLWQIRIHKDLLPDDQRDDRTVQRYRDKFILESEPTLSKILKRQPYICGDRFTAADCMTGHGVIWARAYGLCKSEPFDDYVQRLSERSAFKLAFADSKHIKLSPANLEAIRDKFNG